MNLVMCWALTKFQTAFQFKSNGIYIRSITGRQSDANTQINYRANENWAFSFNDHNQKTVAKGSFFNILHLVDTTSITEPIINHKIEINNQLRKVQEGINTALFFWGGD